MNYLRMAAIPLAMMLVDAIDQLLLGMGL